MKLREAEVLLEQGKSAKEACRALEISEQILLSLAQGAWGTEHHPGQETERTRKREYTPEAPGGRPVSG
jgi:hypothetical protein